MTAAVAIDLEELTPEQQLYRAEKARRAARVRPEMVAAAAELERIEQLARENGKGGRPKGPPLTLGKARAARGRALEPEPDAPGRPEWLTPPTPPKEPDLPAPARRPITPTMPIGTPTNGFAPKECARCGDEFTPKGARSKYCGDACARAAKDSAAADAPKKEKKPKADKPKKKRKPIRTGFSTRSPRSASGSEFAGAIAHLQAKIDAVTAERERLLLVLEQLQELEAE